MAIYGSFIWDIYTNKEYHQKPIFSSRNNQSVSISNLTSVSKQNPLTREFIKEKKITKGIPYDNFAQLFTIMRSCSHFETVLSLCNFIYIRYITPRIHASHATMILQVAVNSNVKHFLSVIELEKKVSCKKTAQIWVLDFTIFVVVMANIHHRELQTMP